MSEPEALPPTILRDDDAYESACDLPAAYSRHRLAVIAAMIKAVEEAVAAERERCAKIAEDLDDMGISSYRDAPEIAARIRSGK